MAKISSKKLPNSDNPDNSYENRSVSNFFNPDNKLPVENLKKIIEELKLAVNCSPKLSNDDLEELKQKVLKAVSK